MKRTIRRNGKPIRQNRPNFRKEVIGWVGVVKFQHKGKKIKSDKWIKVTP